MTTDKVREAAQFATKVLVGMFLWGVGISLTFFVIGAIVELFKHGYYITFVASVIAAVWAFVFVMRLINGEVR
jgi:Na+/citrate or Na+/malate symporter